MKKYILWLAAGAMALAMTQYCDARNASDAGKKAVAIKLNTLHGKKEALMREIKLQDAKRNRQIPDVAPEAMEEINDRQDSLCLALRSELVDVTLEIKELTTDVASPGLTEQYNNLINGINRCDTTAQPAGAPENR